jgi:hypothetical protein
MNQDTLRRQQLQFAHHLRDPELAPPPPGIEARRLELYRELVLGNLQRMLDAALPVCRTLLGENAWQAWVRRFHARHRCRTPLFARIPDEFVAYLQTPQAEAPAWLVELAHYETVELTLQTADDPAPAHLAEADLQTGIPVLSPWLRVLAYRWPVHRLGGDRLPEDTPPAMPTLLLVWRAPTGEVNFAELSPASFRLLEWLAQPQPPSATEALARLASETAAPDPAAFMATGHDLLRHWRQQGVLLGIRSEQAG